MTSVFTVHTGFAGHCTETKTAAQIQETRSWWVKPRLDLSASVLVAGWWDTAVMATTTLLPSEDAKFIPPVSGPRLKASASISINPKNCTAANEKKCSSKRSDVVHTLGETYWGRIRVCWDNQPLLLSLIPPWSHLSPSAPSSLSVWVSVTQSCV